MKYDFIVVGSGAIAGSIAYELASRNFSVCRVGETDRTNAASKAAGAMNGCFGEITSGLLASEHGKLKLNMDCIAKELWPAWAQRLAESSGDTSSLFTAKGTHVILNTAGMEEVDTINYEAIEQTLIDYDAPHEIVDPREIQWLKPNDLVRPLRALYIPDEHALDSHLLLEKLDAAFVAEGGVLKDENVKCVLIEDGVATGVELLSGERLMADKVVVAAGAHSLDLLSNIPSVVRQIPPIFAGYGVSILVRMPKGRELPTSVIRTPNRAFACGLHCVPRGDGVLYLGATNILAEKPRSQALISDVQFLLDCALDQLDINLHDAEILSIQVGNRPIPADGFPLIGECGVNGLWLATGTYRDGLHQSPLLADYIANALTGVENTLINLDSFNPVRPPLVGFSREVMAKETVQQMLATGYEYRWDIKPYWLPLLNEGMTRNYQDLIASLHPQFTPPPELVAFSYIYESMRERLRSYYEAWS
ncbi:NAD(P)/FAD-dependent oxidoreductase [Photorhabdus heterorhabditis]|uniref:FAD-binding oxidoreductase n=1 Tax=Photorhabdus heterorhabditis TaxID=880156 RepID=A0A5B0X5A4_9GAMM|nr:FAD-dependent oxidoreductase [Photorhabdus heterorhabditis]KAA1193757.1 FAD-binding oxidoreductase [Photorhabdus heterorhabditis]KOY64005.1 formimidoyl fortimicin A synthetase [Photorhabdus heterorhabditis]MBS9440446.1 FAD-binding oxidoreductase [Photorhabdus heterorhabditis]NRN27217.1 FAD-binding oxidoreductase [Photorhabdus heterorhabditis subsp. aluminescens]